MENTERGGRLMLYIAWIGVLALLTWAFGGWEQQRREAYSGNANPDPSSTVEGGVITVRLASNGQGHYLSGGRINGKPVTLLLDTGATNVSVPQHLAAKLGMRKGPSGIAHTANGQVKIYLSRIERLQLGDIVLEDVRASINTGMEGDEILLGMSALGQLEFSQRDDELILRQYARP
ncbi:MAG: TIGR02281 family clan AA aspartic protease [Cellvibrionaceae bacterium]|nr:TIGR02281 family clan AA aspartic protease [Cellvibrionaceae bacterium]MCV6624732.1 TIGR02281 family clan AA aspartic protease [Cellvibrionaceae bacterium]